MVKRSKKGQILSNMVKYGQKGPKRSKRSKRVQRGQKGLKVESTGSIRFALFHLAPSSVTSVNSMFCLSFSKFYHRSNGDRSQNLYNTTLLLCLLRQLTHIYPRICFVFIILNIKQYYVGVISIISISISFIYKLTCPLKGPRLYNL